MTGLVTEDCDSYAVECITALNTFKKEHLQGKRVRLSHVRKSNAITLHKK